MKRDYRYSIGEIRERTGFALLPFTVMDVVVWFKFYTVKEQYSKTDGEIDEYHWEIINLIYW